MSCGGAEKYNATIWGSQIEPLGYAAKREDADSTPVTWASGEITVVDALTGETIVDAADMQTDDDGDDVNALLIWVPPFDWPNPGVPTTYRVWIHGVDADAVAGERDHYDGPFEWTVLPFGI